MVATHIRRSASNCCARAHITLAQPQRHVVLDLNGSGLLPKHYAVPEGGVYACTRTPTDTNALQEQASTLPELIRPVLPTTLTELPAVLAAQAPDVRFDRMIGRNALMREPDKAATAKLLAELLRADGVIVLAETVPRHTQRLYRLLNPAVDIDLYQRLVVAEEAIYNASEPMVNWDADDENCLPCCGFVVEVTRSADTNAHHDLAQTLVCCC